MSGNLLQPMIAPVFRSQRLICTTLASGYLSYYVASSGGGLVASLAATTLLMWSFEEWRRHFYLSGRRSARSLSGKLLS